MSEQAKHTPELWTIDSPYTVRTENGEFVCEVAMHSMHSVRESENFATNLLFIAAAPKTAAERDRLEASNAEMREMIVQLSEALQHTLSGQIELCFWKEGLIALKAAKKFI